MMIRRAKFHHGGRLQNPGFKTFQLDHRSRTLSSVNRLVSKFLPRLLLVLAVGSPPTRIVLLVCLPTVHQYFRLQCHAERLRHQLLVFHPLVGPIAPTEHSVTMKILNWHPQDDSCNSGILQWPKLTLQMLLHLIFMPRPPLITALLVSLPKVDSQLVTMSLSPPHDLWGYVELGHSLRSLQPYLTPILCSSGMMTVE